MQPDGEMSGRTVVITGASGAIGAASARALHARGATVVPVGRSAAKTGALAAELGTAPVVADFARLDDVHRAAAELLARCDRIDVLANNAGGMWPRRETTVDGHELTFQVNHLATFLLTALLRERLLASGAPDAPARVITTSSAAHQAGRLDLDNLDSAGHYAGFRVYGTTKLENILFTAELARRTAGSPLVATCFHPGVVAGGFGRDQWLVRLLYQGPLRFLLRSAEQGADTLVWLATAPEVPTMPGGYFADRRLTRTSAAGRDAELARGLWDRSAALVGVQL